MPNDASAPTAPEPERQPLSAYDEQVQEVLAQMTLAEKIGQMTQAEQGTIEDSTDIAMLFLGSVLSGGGSDPAAGNSLEAWLWHTESHYELGQLLQRIGREEESRQVLAEAENLWKQQADITAYQKALTTEPENPYAHAALATAFRMAGRYEEATHTYKVAISLDPQNLEFQNNLASLYFLQKDTVAAIQTYQHILEQDPGMVEVWVNMGILYALSGEESAARQAWQRALAYRPADPTIQGYLAKLDAAP